MAADPFATLVARALGRPIDRVDAGRISGAGDIAGAETQRVRWNDGAESGSLLFRRYPPQGAVEAALLPLLARRGAPVPAVRASGVPPRRAAESRPWLLMDDPGSRPASHQAALAALAAARSLVSRDASTLTSLGLPRLLPSRIRDEAFWAEDLLGEDEFGRVRALAASIDAERSDEAAPTLVHGALEADAAIEGAGGVVLVGWSRAHIGASLSDDPALDPSGRALAALFRIRWHAWEAREMLRPRPLAAALVREILEEYNR